MRDIANQLSAVLLLEPQVLTSTADHTTKILDTAKFDSAAVAVELGEWTGAWSAAATCSFELQESATTANADFTAVAAGNMVGAFTVVDAATKDQTIQSVGYIGHKRYLRLKIDMTPGTGTGITAAPTSVIGVLGHPDNRPSTAPAPVTAT